MIFLAALLKLALLTSDQIPESSKPDDQLLIEALRDYQVEAQSVDWDSPTVAWTNFDAVLISSTWDYYRDPQKFLHLLREIESLGPKVYNPPAIVEWNSRKTYLQDLRKLGLNTLETIYLSSTELKTLRPLLLEKGWDECVVKPQISADGYHTYRFNLSSLDSIPPLFQDYEELLMVQPFAEEILSEGEWSFVFVDNDYMHCVLKRPLPSNFLVQKGEKIPIEPPSWMIEEAKHIHKTLALPTFQCRIDVIRRDNKLIIMEVEMIEPSLYLRYFPGSEKRVAKKMHEKLKEIQPSIVNNDGPGM